MSAILFDRTDPDEPDPTDPEERAILLGGFAILKAERLAAAAGATAERWWRLLLNADAARAPRLEVRYLLAEETRRDFAVEFARAAEAARPHLDPPRYARLVARAAKLADDAQLRARAKFATGAAAN